MATRLRRTKGEGTIRQYRPGRWLAQSYHAGQRVSATGTTATDARRALAEKVAGLATATQSARDAEDSTGAYLTRWLAETKRALKPSTWRRYDSSVRCHLAPVLGALPLAELRREDIARLHASMRSGAHGCRPQTDTSIAHGHACLRVALQAAVDRGLLAANVAASYRAPRMHHRDKVILRADQMSRLLAAAKGTPMEAVAALVATTGMREGEILGLRWGDVDLASGTLWVRSNATRDYDGRRILADPKTASGARTIVLSRVAVDALTAARGEAKPPDLVYPGRDGQPMSGHNFLRHHWYPLLDRAGLPRMPFHDVRHSAATVALQAGVPAHVVSQQLGHSSVAVTLRLYGHVTQEMRRDAADAMDRALGG